MTPEYFAAMRLLLDSAPSSTPLVEWPGDLVAGAYRAVEGECAMQQLNPLHLCRWAGKPGFACDGRSGFVRSTTTVQHGAQTLQRWQLEWDDGSGRLFEDTLLLAIHSDESFTLYDQHGNANQYVLEEAAWTDARFWPQPLAAGRYRAEEAPGDMVDLELLQIGDDTCLQTAYGITFLTQMQTHADGIIQAVTQWCYYDGREPASESVITLRITDQHSFTLANEEGVMAAYRWYARS